MADQPKPQQPQPQPQKPTIEQMLLANLRDNNADPERYDREKEARDDACMPIQLPGQRIPPQELNPDGSLKRKG